MEAARLAYRQEGTAQSQPEVQAKTRAVVEQRRREAVAVSGTAEHADRRAQSETATA